MLNRRDTLFGLALCIPQLDARANRIFFRDIRTFPDIRADGKTDDFLALQAAFRVARSEKTGILWPSGVKTFVQFSREHPHIFIDGALNFRGENRETSGISFQCDYDMGVGHAPLFCFGISSIGSLVNKISGTIEHLGWFLESGCKKFERCCMIYGAENLVVQDCFADFRKVTWPARDNVHPKGYSAGGWWCSNFQAKFARGQTRDKNVRFIRNVGFALAEYQNAESLGLSNTDGLQFIGNELTGWSDDLAAHDCTDVIMQGNIYRAVAGRLYLEGCQHAKIIGNIVEPVEQPITRGFLGPYRRFIHADMVINSYPVGAGAAATERPNSDIVIADNIINLPAGSFCAGAISVWGLQDNLQIIGNKIRNFGAQSPVTAISVLSGYRNGWIGPAGNPDNNSGGAIRMRNVAIRGNQLAGPGWHSDEGTIGISGGGRNADIIGPIVVEDNLAGSYYIPYKTVTFNRNSALPNSKNPYKNVDSTLRKGGIMPNVSQ